MLLYLIAAAVAAALPQAPVATPPAAANQADQRFTVVVEGEGPDVILIPGLASSRKVWAGISGRLAKAHRVHLIQVAGFAGLPAGPNASGAVAAPLADAIASYVRANNLKAPAIIGHSLGGEVALIIGARHPGTAGRLMVVDALPFYSLIIDPTATVEKVAPRAAALRDAMLAASADQSAAMGAASIARLVKTEAARGPVIEDGRTSDRTTVANAVYEVMTTDLRPELTRIKAPTTIVYAYDAVYGVPPAAIDSLFGNAYKGLAGVQLDRIDGSFHFVMLDQPALFDAAVDRFLKGS